MIRIFRHALNLALLLGALNAAEDTGCELHLIKFGDIPDMVTLKTIPEGKTIKMEASPGYFQVAAAIPKAEKANLVGEKLRGTMALGEITLPIKGRHLLLLMTAFDSKAIRRAIVPADAEHLPKGCLGFLNLTSRNVRCYLDSTFVELAPGEMKAHPSVSLERRYVRHYVMVSDDGVWKTNGSTMLTLGANRRYIMVVTEDSPKGPIRRDMITDAYPDVTMAPLVKPEPPVIAEPPPLDQPAK